MKLADFGLAIEVQGDQQAWFGECCCPPVPHSPCPLRVLLWAPALCLLCPCMSPESLLSSCCVCPVLTPALSQTHHVPAPVPTASCPVPTPAQHIPAPCPSPVSRPCPPPLVAHLSLLMLSLSLSQDLQAHLATCPLRCCAKRPMANPWTSGHVVRASPCPGPAPSLPHPRHGSGTNPEPYPNPCPDPCPAPAQSHPNPCPITASPFLIPSHSHSGTFQAPFQFYPIPILVSPSFPSHFCACPSSCSSSDAILGPSCAWQCHTVPCLCHPASTGDSPFWE